MLKGYLSKPVVGSQTRKQKCDGMRVPYTGADGMGLHCSGRLKNISMVETRIKPYLQEVEEKARRAEQTRLYRRNQAIGLVLVAVAILIFWLFRTNPRWIFPQGWWRP
jgi:hypothetical protein